MLRKTLLSLIGSLLTACGVQKRAASSPPSSDRDADRRIDLEDQLVIAHLRKNGSDLSKPTEIVHYLYIPSRSDAEAAAGALNHDGYRAVVEEPLGKLSDGRTESRYSVIARINTAPRIETIRAARAKFDALARRYRGDYDGWEAAVRR